MNSMQPRRPQEEQTFNTWASMGLIRIYSSVANVHCGNVFFAGTEPELVDEDFLFFFSFVAFETFDWAYQLIIRAATYYSGGEVRDH
jgi:hypothetical protein